MATTVLRWLGIVLAVLLLLVMLAMLWVDHDDARGWVERWASARSGREVSIARLDADLSLTPRFRLEGVSVGSAPWARGAHLFAAQQATFSVHLPALLRGRLVVPELHLVRPELLLEKSADGQGNWRFGEEEDGGPPALPAIGDLRISDGRLAYEQLDGATDFDIRQLEANGAVDASGVRLDAQGRFADQSSALRLRAGPVTELSGDAPYPLQAEGRVGETRFSLAGHMDEPLAARGLDLQLRLQGQSLDELFLLLRIPLPATPPYQVAGRLTQQGALWDFSGVDGVIGNSDIGGSLSVDAAASPAFLRANLFSRRLDYRDLGGLVGAVPGRPIRAVPGEVLPEQPAEPARLQAIDMVVEFRGERVLAPRLPLDDVRTTATLQNGRLTFDPLQVGVSGGDARGSVVYDARQRPPRVEAALRLTQLRIARFLPGVTWFDTSVGRLNGSLDLRGPGLTLGSFFGAANGRLVLLMSGGALDNRLVEMIGLDIAETLLVLNEEGSPTRVRCAVGVFEVEDGLLQSDALVIDTEDSLLEGSGSIDLGKERLALRVLAHPKDSSLLSVRSPVGISGTFADPEIELSEGEIAGQVGAAFALGALLGPVAGLIPLFEPGTAEDAACGDLLGKARQAQPSVPQ